MKCRVQMGKKVRNRIEDEHLDVANGFMISSGGEGVFTLSEDLHEVVSEITSSQVETEDCVVSAYHS
jgi:hypothetical protein